MRNSGKRLKRALGDCEDLLDDWLTIATVIRDTVREMFGVSYGKRMDDKKTLWW